MNLPDGYLVTFNLFYRPDLIEEATSGQQIENYSTTEFLPKEEPIERMDVVIHELCHFFLESVESEKFSALQKRFLDQGSLSSVGAYNLMNETLATAFGNGMINKISKTKEQWAKYLSREQSFYNNSIIDRAAKTVLPLLEQWLEDSKTLYHADFVNQYVTTLNKSFGPALSAPKLLLNELVLVADSKYGGKFRDHVRKALRASSMYTSEGKWEDDRFLETYKKIKV